MPDTQDVGTSKLRSVFTRRTALCGRRISAGSMTPKSQDLMTRIAPTPLRGTTLLSVRPLPVGQPRPASRAPFLPLFVLPFFAPLLAGVLVPADASAAVLKVTAIDGSALVDGTDTSLSDLVNAMETSAAAVQALQSTAYQAYTTASTSLQQRQLGAAGGVATLDGSGNLTAPLNTTNISANTAASFGWNDTQLWSLSSGTGTQYANTQIAMNMSWQMGTDASGNPTTDDYMPPSHLRLGGSQEFDGVPLFVHNVPYGPADMGIVDGVFMQSQNMRGSEAGIAPNGAAEIAKYDNFDAVARYTYVGPNAPVFTATGSAVSAPDGLTHIPVFSATGATFANPLPAKWSSWIKTHPRAHIMTNEIGIATGSIRTYVAQITSYTTTPTGLVSSISTDGWRIFSQPTATSNQVPGVSTVDGSTPALDTVWSNFGDPAIMFGVYTKAFGSNVICNLPGPTPNAKPGDINYPTGNANNQVRACEGIEYDLWNNDTTGNTSYMHGITVAYSGSTSPTSQSYDMNLAGGNANMLEINGEWYSTNIASHAFTSAGYGGPAYTRGSSKVVADFAQSNRPQWDADTSWPVSSHNMRLTIWNTRTQDDTANQNDYNDITTSIGVQVDGHNDPTKGVAMDGTVQEHLEFNPASFPNGIALCGYQVCGFAVDGAGQAKFTSDTHIMAGKALYFHDNNGVSRGYFYADTAGALHYASASGNLGLLTLDATLHSNGAINAPNNAYANLPTTSNTTGDQRYCSDCYSTSGSSAHKGIPVWWSGTAWADSLGATALH